MNDEINVVCHLKQFLIFAFSIMVSLLQHSAVVILQQVLYMDKRIYVSNIQISPTGSVHFERPD